MNKLVKKKDFLFQNLFFCQESDASIDYEQQQQLKLIINKIYKYKSTFNNVLPQKKKEFYILSKGSVTIKEKIDGQEYPIANINVGEIFGFNKQNDQQFICSTHKSSHYIIYKKLIKTMPQIQQQIFKLQSKKEKIEKEQKSLVLKLIEKKKTQFLPIIKNSQRSIDSSIDSSRDINKQLSIKKEEFQNNFNVQSQLKIHADPKQYDIQDIKGLVKKRFNYFRKNKNTFNKQLELNFNDDDENQNKLRDLIMKKYTIKLLKNNRDETSISRIDRTHQNLHMELARQLNNP